MLTYVFEGEASVGQRELPRGTLAELGDGDEVALRAAHAARVLVIGARPIREPVVHYGPFVMNTAAEIEQAIRDYQSGRLTSAA